MMCPAPAPERIDLYLLDIVCVFLHSCFGFSFGKYKENIGKLYRYKIIISNFA